MNSAITLTVISIFTVIGFGLVTKKISTTVPWMGVLLYKPDDQSVQEATHIVMVDYLVALANAKDIGAVNWYLLQKNGKAVFNSGNRLWEVGLTGRLLHPEYKNGSLNTIAILFLKRNDNPRLWKPIKLIEGTDKVNRLSKIFSIGYTDHNKILKQEMNAMEYVSQSTCKDFYVQEEIDMDFLWPPNPICFRVMDANETCLDDAGKALASNSTEEWLLMGLGTYGPGCSLPARYIEILPYAKWIKDTTEVKKATRRGATNVEAIKSYPYVKPYEDEDFLKRLRDDTYTMDEKLANKTEIVEGCTNPDDNKTLMYFESDIIETKYVYNIGIYRIKITDLNFIARTCVKVYVRCHERSNITWTVDKKPQYVIPPMQTKTIPFRIRDIPQKNVYKLISDPRPIIGRETYTLQFRFSFKYDAYIEVKVYGKYNGTSMKKNHYGRPY